MPDDEDQPKTVKQLLASKAPLDAASQRDLERWFGLPSFAEVAERPAPPGADDDPEIVAMRERKLRVAGDVDKALLDRSTRGSSWTPRRCCSSRRGSRCASIRISRCSITAWSIAR